MKRIRMSRSVLSGLAFAFATGVPLTAAAQLQDFDMEQVRVTDEYLQQLFTADVDYLLRLDPDRLLAGFEAVSRGQDPENGVTLYGGWEGGWSLLRGHTMGHYLTALAQAHKQTVGTDPTMNQQINSVLDHVISEMKTYQDRTGGYLFASPESHFDRLEAGSSDIWVPWYGMHKVLSGIIDVYKLTGNETALEVASRLGDWVYNRASSWNSSMRSQVLGIEYGGMNDCLYELYKQTGSQDHLSAAHIFDEDSFFDPIASGQDNLNGKHANTQIPKIVGALNRYRTLGNAESHYLTVAEQFWEIVLSNHTYVTGGNSELEHFHEPRQLDAYRDNTNAETCNSHNMLKLTRELFKITSDVNYADYFERAFINEILSSINPETGMTTYFKPMGTGYHKVFGTETDSFWCCTGTGMENFTKLNESIYFHDDSDLYVNLFISSTLNWTERSLSLTQTANIPLSPTVSFTIDAAPANEMGIKFRKPYWLAAGELPVLTVNGAAVCTESVGGYFEVSRVWSAGDTIQYTLPADVTVSRLPDNQNAVAFMYGPVVLSAGMGTDNLTAVDQWASKKAAEPTTPKKQTIAITSGTVEDWIANINDNLVQTPGALEFTLQNTDEDNNLSFTPQYLRYQDRYGIYFVLEGEQGTNQGTGGTTGDVSTDCEAVVGTGGAGAGGVVNTGGSPVTGGTGGTPVGTGGVAVGTGGVVVAGTGGVVAGTGGAPLGGTLTGGAPPVGGSGAVGVGGAPAAGTGGTMVSTTGGVVAAGNATGVGGGGAVAPQATGGTEEAAPSDEDSGCSCTTPVEKPTRFGASLGSLLLGLVLWGSRRRSRRCRETTSRI
jgi:DUF1680 family protein